MGGELKGFNDIKEGPKKSVPPIGAIHAQAKHCSKCSQKMPGWYQQETCLTKSA